MCVLTLLNTWYLDLDQMSGCKIKSVHCTNYISNVWLQRLKEISTSVLKYTSHLVSVKNLNQCKH